MMNIGDGNDNDDNDDDDENYDDDDDYSCNPVNFQARTSRFFHGSRSR